MHTTPTRRLAMAFAALFTTSGMLASQASAQYSQRPGIYIGNDQIRVNPWNRSVHIPGQAVYKPSGTYHAIGGGYYQNPSTGNKYNPHTGSYLQGTRPGFSSVEQRPGAYFGGNNLRVNPWNGSVHLPGQAVIKPSGTYRPIGGGYYRNPATGNTYNPSTGQYIRNW